MRKRTVAFIVLLLLLQYTVLFATGFDAKISYEVKNKRIYVTNSVSNSSKEDKEIFCIMARCTSDGAVKKAYAESLTVPAELTAKVDVPYDYPCEADDYIKMMIWDRYTIEPYVYEFKHLVSLYDCESFDSAKLVFPQYVASPSGGYVIERDRDGDGKINFNDAEVTEEGRFESLSSSYTITGSNLFWEVSSIKDGALYVNARNQFAQGNTYTPAKFKVYFKEPVTEKVTISAKVKFEVYTRATFRTNFMSVCDKSGKYAIQMLSTQGGLCAYDGSSLNSTVLVNKTNSWYDLKYEIDMENKTFVVYVDDKRMASYKFNNQAVSELSYIYFENGSTADPAGICTDFYIDDITVDNGI